MTDAPAPDTDPEDAPQADDEFAGRLQPDQFRAIGQLINDAAAAGSTDPMAHAAAALFEECAHLVTEREQFAQDAQTLAVAVAQMHVEAHHRGDLGVVAAMHAALRRVGALGPDETLPLPAPELHVPNRAERRALERAARKGAA